MTTNNESNKTQTIYYQGITESQTQLARYVANGFTASTGETVICKSAINVINDPFLGPEIQDVNLKPFSAYSSFLVDIVFCTKSFISNWIRSIKISPPSSEQLKYDEGSVRFHSLKLSTISVGQESDMSSHQRKYDAWQNKKNDGDHLILYGASRGAVTTFNAMAEYKYPEVKLVILEGCFYSINDIMSRRYYWPLPKMIEAALSLFAYDPKGISPSSQITKFPENVPVVFISSRIDEVVPYASTLQLAQELANKSKNEVYLLTLQRSRHPHYMVDNAIDRSNYESFIHAVYKKYNIKHDARLAENGAALLGISLLKANTKHNIPADHTATQSWPIFIWNKITYPFRLAFNNISKIFSKSQVPIDTEMELFSYTINDEQRTKIKKFSSMGGDNVEELCDNLQTIFEIFRTRASTENELNKINISWENIIKSIDQGLRQFNETTNLALNSVEQMIAEPPLKNNPNPTVSARAPYLLPRYLNKSATATTQEDFKAKINLVRNKTKVTPNDI